MYFDLDQDALKPEFQAAMACRTTQPAATARARAWCLEAVPTSSGSREYNLAWASAAAMRCPPRCRANGGSGSQITVISYGEERRSAMNPAKAAGRRNRRVELVYSAK